MFLNLYPGTLAPARAKREETAEATVRKRRLVLTGFFMARMAPGRFAQVSVVWRDA